MHEAQLIEAVRYAGGFKTDDTDYGDGRIRRELNDTLLSSFSRVIVSSTEGYWKHCRTWSITSGTQDYKIFHRASVGGLVTVEVRESSTSPFYPLSRASQQEAASMESGTGSPTHFQEFHDFLRLYPSPTVSGWALRMWFYLRPSLLVEKQPGTTYGYITAVNTSTRVLEIEDSPYNRDTDAQMYTPELASSHVIDVVDSTGIHALHLIEATAASSGGADYTLSATNPDGSTLDMSRVQVGDYVRAAQQTDWPPLPQEFHQTLADATAAAILMRQGVGDRARMLSEKVQSDLQRMSDLIDPRVKESPRYLKHRFGPLAGRSRGSGWAR